jgi:ATP-dependent protease HslVU (ClpYQ) ATPase subunit
MEKLVEEISYNLPDETKSEIVIDCEYVKEKFADKLQQDDIDKFIL